jgi:hypothetical protein
MDKLPQARRAGCTYLILVDGTKEYGREGMRGW